jgi:hypothetical protein
VCGQANAAANTPPDIPPGILYPSVPVPPVVGAPSGPAPIGRRTTPLPDGRRRLLAEGFSGGNLAWNISALPSPQAADGEPVVHPQASCNGPGNPLYNVVPPSQTYCSLIVNLLDGLNFYPCSATFIRPNMVVTAGYCILDTAMQYNIDPANPGRFG